ncbi:MAG: Hsp20/alpha crystallin family protein, partial [Bacillota bacterium]|nr:Hsp20/alpha crystallin family protein [Bacillota bacterium]
MSREQGKEGAKDDRAEIRTGLGLGGLLKGIGEFVDLISKMEAGERIDRRSEVEIPGPGKVVYGFSVKVGLGGKPVVERFGNVKETAAGVVVQEIREPYTDVLDEGDELVVIAELPGIETESVSLEIHGDVFSLKAESGTRKYAKELLLPYAVDEQSLSHSCQRGI